MSYISQTKAAILLGMSQQNLSKHIKLGRITAPAIGSRNRVDPEIAKKQLENSIDSMRGGDHAKRLAGGKGGANDMSVVNESFAKARALKEVTAARLLELDYKERTKELVQLAEVCDSLFVVIRESRDALGKVHDRIGAVVANSSDEFICKELIRKEIRQALKAAEDKLIELVDEEIAIEMGLDSVVQPQD